VETFASHPNPLREGLQRKLETFELGAAFNGGRHKKNEKRLASVSLRSRYQGPAGGRLPLVEDRTAARQNAPALNQVSLVKDCGDHFPELKSVIRIRSLRQTMWVTSPEIITAVEKRKKLVVKTH